MPRSPHPQWAWRWRSLRALALALLALAATSASGHALKVFAFAVGARIEGTVSMAGGGAVGGVRILVRDTAGRTLAELAPDADGAFGFEAQAPTEHIIVAESADGHRAEWRIGAAEIAGAFQGPPAAAAAGAPTQAGALDPGLEAAIERAVARQLRPLREALHEERDTTRLRDVLGGIGYILGLVGVALWWRCRRPADPR